MNVLLIDDCRTYATVLSGACKNNGIGFLHVESIREAIHVIESRVFDLVLVDRVMPFEQLTPEQVVQFHKLIKGCNVFVISGTQAGSVDIVKDNLNANRIREMSDSEDALQNLLRLVAGWERNENQEG